MQRILDRLPGVFRVALALLALLLGAAVARADETRDRERLDRLFAELRVAPDAEQASIIDQQIWLVWMVPSDPQLAGRMNEVMSARRMGDLIEAILLLNRLIEDYPDYAEAWNQRATMYYMVGNYEASIADCARVLELEPTMYYMVGNYEASIADCARVLELEPRHFGALSGRAVMYLQRGMRAEALRDMRAALAVHPFLTERRLFPELEQEEMTRI